LFPAEAFIVCKGFQPPPSLESYLSSETESGSVETPTTNASLMQAFTDPSFLSSSSPVVVEGGYEKEGAEVEEEDRERRKILGWVEGGDLR